MERNNKLILSNSLILYVRLFIISITGLVVTRVILQGLGENNFGIYSVVGGIVALMGLINTVMLSASNRFIAFELGRGDVSKINKIFNVSFSIHAFIAAIVLILAKVVGEWYIINYLNVPEGKVVDALWVFRFSIVGAAISFLGVPYCGLLTAKENFLIFCGVDVLASITKLALSFFILYFFKKNLLLYAGIMAVVIACPTIVYVLYCRKHYIEIVKSKFFNKWSDYKEILNFSLWVGYGAIASVGKNQGAVLLINYFFGVALNAALGIANSINGIVSMFAQSVGRAISPQITKSYAAGDLNRTEDLVIAASKYTFFLLLIPSVPILLEAEYLLGLWLKIVPEYTAIFIRLMILDALVLALNAGIPEVIFASGKIKWYQIVVNTIFLLSLPVAYIALKHGAKPYAVQYSFIVITIVALCVRQIFLYVVVKFNIRRIVMQSYCPALFVSLALLLLYFLLKAPIHPFGIMIISLLYLIIMIIFLGLNIRERNYVYSIIRSTFKKIS